MTGAQIVIKTLIEQGCDTVFVYPGGAVLNIYDEHYLHSDKITHILTAHEQGAAHAADAYARVSGKVGVVMATSGPGATNLVTGIATAYLDSTPLVAITGNPPSYLLGRQLSGGRHRHYSTDYKTQLHYKRFRACRYNRKHSILQIRPSRSGARGYSKDIQIQECEFTPAGAATSRRRSLQMRNIEAAKYLNSKSRLFTAAGALSYRMRARKSRSSPEGGSRLALA